jgi:hypothetical protein
MTTDTLDPFPPHHQARVLELAQEIEAVAPQQDELWRLEMFGTLGIEYNRAKTLAAHKVDWHAAKRMIDAGCPPNLAAEILT